VALGRLDWSLRRIEEATGVRRETASAYLRAAGIPCAAAGVGRESGRQSRPPRRRYPPTVKAKPAISSAVSNDSEHSKPATTGAVSTDFAERVRPGRAPSASACEPYRELIAEALAHGRNAMAIWQDLYYGDGPMVRYPQTGKYRRTRLFVLTLGYSRKSIRLLVWHSSTQMWAALHERAFLGLGGTVRVIVYDYVARHIIVVMCPPSICGGVAVTA
jgi:hypothetical protein